MKKVPIVLCISLVLGICTSSVQARAWIDSEPADHNWSSPANWVDALLPVTGDNVELYVPQANEGTHPVLQTGDVVPATGQFDHVWLGNDTNNMPSGINAMLEMNGGTMNILNAILIGFGNPSDSSSTLVMTDGTINLASGAPGHFWVGHGNGSADAGPGYFTQSGGTVNADTAVFGAGASYAEVNLSGGTFNVTDTLHMWDPGSRVNISGGTLSVAAFAPSGSAVISITSGAFILDGNMTNSVAVWINQGILTGAKGTLAYDYNTTNPGKTTVTCGPQSSQTTIAYWRFEGGTAGVTHTNGWDNFYQDASGFGNHMSTWPIGNDGNCPAATADRPFTSVPLTGAANDIALDFTADSRDIGTFGWESPGAKMIQSLDFTDGWTVECTFKGSNLGYWQVVVGIDGEKDDHFAGGDEPPLALKVFGDSLGADFKKMFLALIDDDGTPHWVMGNNALVEGQWYSVAATYDNATKTASFYIKGESDIDYVLQNTLHIPAGVTFGKWHKSWTIGRGAWNNGPADFFSGIIDEVRISDVALALGSFLGAPGDLSEIGSIMTELLPSGLALTWNTGSGYDYTLQSKIDLSDGWLDDTTGIAGTGGDVTVTTAVDQAHSFYRVISE